MTKKIRKLEIRTSESSQELLRSIPHLDFGIPQASVIRASSFIIRGSSLCSVQP